VSRLLPFLLLLLAGPAAAQVAPALRPAPAAPPATPASAASAATHGNGAPGLVPVRAHGAVPAPGVRATLATPPGAFLASLAVPGSGQAALGLRRWVVYGLLEVGLWAAHLDARSDFHSFSDRYRDLAWETARTPGGLPREDGGWGYYEAMRDYLSSGAYDVDAAAAGVQPEVDESTYNGAVWRIARGLYLGGGEGPGTEPYDSALAYYGERAAGPAFLWSWVGLEDELDRFRGLIARADDESRVATNALGLVLANHLVSAVDALVVARLRTNDGVRLESRTTPAGSTLRWSVGLRIPIPH
jgi:hypothetical protein